MQFGALSSPLPFSIAVAEMSVFTAPASTVVSSTQQPPVGCNRQGKLTESGQGSVSFRFHPLGTKRAQAKIGELRAVEHRTLFLEIRYPVMHSTRRHTSSVICAAALNARCASEQTQTVTRQAPTMTHVPAKEKLPDLDDGGTGFPPRDDGDGGGGGGGGGGNWSGGFFFFGFLTFLGFLKDKESEGPYDNNRRR